MSKTLSPNPVAPVVIETPGSVAHSSIGGKQPEPVFGLILLGGPLSGALIRDVRLANELADRGYRVHVWWAMDRRKSLKLHPSITEYWLFHGLRYLPVKGFHGTFRWLLDSTGRMASRIFSDKTRAHYLQHRPQILERVMHGLLLHVCQGVQCDGRVIRRFTRELDAAAVTHVLPMLAALCPWATVAGKLMQRPADLLVTFQGYELYSNYARRLGCERELYDRFVEAVDQSNWPAIAVSEDYVDRVVRDIGVERDKVRAIPPGVPIPPPLDRNDATKTIASSFRRYQPGVPLITYVGRRDAEKGIDLLLYAATILRQRGVGLQLAICGPTLFGDEYGNVCKQIAENLRCPVMWYRHISDELRSALFAGSDAVIYPSIHREPFGMVPVEAMSYGTPVVVPDYGGVASIIEAEGHVGGIQFRVWDSGDLADKIQSLIEDRAQWQQLADAGPKVAEYYSVAKLTDRVLNHLEL